MLPADNLTSANTKKIGYYQCAIDVKNPKHNLAKIIDAILKEKFDLLVLPELFTCGYFFLLKKSYIV